MLVFLNKNETATQNKLTMVSCWYVRKKLIPFSAVSNEKAKMIENLLFVTTSENRRIYVKLRGN